MAYGDDSFSMQGDESIFDTPSPLDAQRILAQTVRRNPALTMPTGGVVQKRPNPMPPAQMPTLQPERPPQAAQATPSAAAPDYRSLAMKALTDAQNIEPTEAERGDSNRKLVLALTLGSMGGSGMKPFAQQLSQQALVDPEVKGQRRAQRLEAQARLYESMAQHAETVAQRREAQEKADTLRRDLAEQGAALRRDIAGMTAGQGKFQFTHDSEGNIVAIGNQRSGEVTYPGGRGGAGGARQPMDVLPKGATAEEKNHYATAAETIATANRLVNEVKADPEAFGLVTGVASQFSNKTGIPVQKMVLTPQQQQLRAGVSQKAYEVINKLAGAALSSHEAGRIMGFAPGPNDDADTIIAKLNSAIQIANEQRGTLQKRYGLGQQPGAPAAPGAPAPAPGGGSKSWKELNPG